MRVYLKVFANLRDYLPAYKPGTPLEVEIEQGSTLDDLVEKFNLPRAEVKVTFVNARAQPLSYALQPDDEIGIFPPIGGG